MSSRVTRARRVARVLMGEGKQGRFWEVAEACDVVSLVGEAFVAAGDECEAAAGGGARCTRGGGA